MYVTSHKRPFVPPIWGIVLCTGIHYYQNYGNTLIVDTHTAITLYKSMILPITEYGSVIYGGASGKRMQKLQNTQHRILRLCIYSNVYIETEQLFGPCKTSKLDLRREAKLNLFMFEQQSNIEIVNKRVINTRAHGALLFTTKKPNNEKYKQNILYRGALSWNSLPV